MPEGLTSQRSCDKATQALRANHYPGWFVWGGTASAMTVTHCSQRPCKGRLSDEDTSESVTREIVESLLPLQERQTALESRKMLKKGQEQGKRTLYNDRT